MSEKRTPQSFWTIAGTLFKLSAMAQAPRPRFSTSNLTLAPGERTSLVLDSALLEVHSGVGDVRIETDGNVVLRSRMTPGDLLVLPSPKPQCVHLGSSEETLEVVSWSLVETPVRSIMQSAHIVPRERVTNFQRTLCELLSTARDPAVARHLLSALLTDLRAVRSRVSRGIPDDVNPHEDEVPPLQDQIVIAAIRLFESDLAHPWTLRELSLAVGASRAALVRRFRRAFGEPPLRHLTHRRMAEAANLLLETDASLAEISVQVGYESEFALSRAFKRHHGVSPREYRTRHPITRPLAIAA